MSHRLPEDLERAVSKLAGRYLAARRPEQLAKCPTCGSTAEKGIDIGCCPTFDCPGVCQWRSKKGPPWRCKKGPLGGCGLVP